MLNTLKGIKDASATEWCRPVRWIGVLAVLAIFWLASAPAKADDIVTITLTNLTFSCPPPATCTETFTVPPFKYDSTTNTIVPNTLFPPLASGVLNPESFAFFNTFTGPAVPTGFETEFNWSGSAGDGVVAFFIYTTELLPTNITSQGSALGCHSTSCIATFANNVPGTGIMTVSAVPEPSSLLLLSTGLLGFAGAIRRKLFR